MADEKTEIAEKMVELGSDTEPTAAGPEEIGRCRVYGDNDVIDCALRQSEYDCAAYARSHIEEPIEDRKDYKGRIITYGWSPGYNCNGDWIGD